MERRDDLWQRAHDQARSLLRRYPDPWTRSHQEDLVQEASIAAWRWARAARHNERLWAAVRTIALRIRGRALRQHQRLGVAHDLTNAEPCEGDEPGERYYTVAGRRVCAQQVGPWLRAALARLKAIDRQLLLGFYEGFCCAELAERVRRSETCVKTRIHRARRRIQDEVEACARAAGGFDG